MKDIIWHTLLNLTGTLFDAVDYIYNIFYYLCGYSLFSTSDYTHIVKNIYVILGIVMMFVLSYSLLKAVINPDEFAKGETSFPKLIKNILVSLVLIVIMPTIFEVGYNIQNSILNYNVIPKLILNNDTAENGSALDIDGMSGGRYIAYEVYQAFLIANMDSEVCDENDAIDEVDCRNYIKSDGVLFWRGDTMLSEADNNIKNGKSFSYYADYNDAVKNGELSFNFIFAIASAIFLVFALLNFCFDVALRVIKLAFYQIIAPIPIVCRIIPGGKLKDVFSKWVKQVISLFFEVFIRVGVLTLGVYLIRLIAEKAEYLPDLPGGVSSLFIKALLIMSVVMFIKQAPKLISDLFGIDTGGMKLGLGGLKEKLADGGALAAGAVIGGTAGSIGRNAVSRLYGKKNWLDKDGKLTAKSLGKNVLFAAASIGAGAISGGVRGFNAGKGAKNFGDMKKAAGNAVEGTTKARLKRDAYRASHDGGNAFQTAANVMLGHAADTVAGVGEYFGINSSQALIEDNKTIDNIDSKKKAIKTAAENLILGEGAKGQHKNFGLQGLATFKYTDEKGQEITANASFDAAELYRIKQKADIAKANGDPMAITLENMYKSYLDTFTKAVQNQGALGESSFNSLLQNMNPDDAEELKADLSETMTLVNEFRKIVGNNINKTYIQDSGFKLDMLDRNNDLDLNSGPVKIMGNKMKNAKKDNNDKIRKKEDEKKNNNS